MVMCGHLLRTALRVEKTAEKEKRLEQTARGNHLTHLARSLRPAKLTLAQLPQHR